MAAKICVEGAICKERHPVKYHLRLYTIYEHSGWIWVAISTIYTNFWTQNQSEQHSKLVQLPEVLWQYHVHPGPKQQLVVNRSHRGGCKWLRHAK